MKKRLCLGLLMSCLITGNVGFAESLDAVSGVYHINDNKEHIFDEDNYNIDTSKMEELYKTGILVEGRNSKVILESNNLDIYNLLKNPTDDIGYSISGLEVRNDGEFKISVNDANIKVYTDKDFATGIKVSRWNGDYGSEFEISADDFVIDVYSENSRARGIDTYNNSTDGKNIL